MAKSNGDLDSMISELIYQIPHSNGPANSNQQLDKESINAKVLVWLSDHTDDDARQLLDKILESVGISSGEAYIANLDIPYRSLTARVPATHIICFGLAPQDIGLQIQSKLFRVTQFDNRKILFAEKLSILMDDRDMKLKLWSSLKSMFNVNQV